MSNTDSNTSADTNTDGLTTDAAETVTYEKGTWQDSLNKSAVLFDRSAQGRKRASSLLWTGAQVAIEEWMPSASTDVGAENLYNEVLSILGTPRKGDASKIKTVALAHRNHGLILATYPNLSKAYAEATRLTKTVQAQAQEDDAAEKAVESIDAPKTATTAESAALILLSKGIDGAVVAILDALGANNFEAHRAFVRAVSTEVASRVQAAKPKPTPKAGPKAGATQATAGGTAAPKAAKAGTGKAKPVATAGTKAKPVAKPVAKKATAEPVTEPVHAGDDVPDHTEAAAEVAVTTPPVATKPVRRAVPVQRRAARPA